MLYSPKAKDVEASIKLDLFLTVNLRINKKSGHYV